MVSTSWAPSATAMIEKLVPDVRAPLDGVDHALDAVGDLGDQDHVRSAGDARRQRQPAGPVAHDLGQDDPVVAVGRAVEAVDGLRGDRQRRREPDGRVGLHHVVVDGLGQHHDVEPCLDQPEAVLGRPVATDAHEGIQLVPLVRLDDLLGHVHDHAVHRHPVGLVAAGPQDRAAHGEDPGQGPGVQAYRAVLGEAAEAVAEAHEAHPVVPDGRLAEPADGRVEAGAVAARGQDPDSLHPGHRPLLVALGPPCLGDEAGQRRHYPPPARVRYRCLGIDPASAPSSAPVETP